MSCAKTPEPVEMPSVYGGDAACCQITLTACCYWHGHSHQ